MWLIEYPLRHTIANPMSEAIKQGIPTLEEVQLQFEGHAPEALVDAYRMLGEAEAEGRAVFESSELSNAVKLERLERLKNEWTRAYQLILFWSAFTPGGTTEN